MCGELVQLTQAEDQVSGGPGVGQGDGFDSGGWGATEGYGLWNDSDADAQAYHAAYGFQAA